MHLLVYGFHQLFDHAVEDEVGEDRVLHGSVCQRGLGSEHGLCPACLGAGAKPSLDGVQLVGVPIVCYHWVGEEGVGDGAEEKVGYSDLLRVRFRDDVS